MSWADYAHPVFGGIVVGLVLSLGSMGLRARSWPKRRKEFLQWHVRLGPWVCAAALLAQASGFAAVWLGRFDLQPGTSVHFRTGTLLTAVLLLLWCTRPFMHQSWIRQVHPWLGALAMLVAGAHAFFGLQLMR